MEQPVEQLPCAKQLFLRQAATSATDGRAPEEASPIRSGFSAGLDLSVVRLFV